MYNKEKNKKFKKIIRKIYLWKNSIKKKFFLFFFKKKNKEKKILKYIITIKIKIKNKNKKKFHENNENKKKHSWKKQKNGGKPTFIKKINKKKVKKIYSQLFKK